MSVRIYWFLSSNRSPPIQDIHLHVLRHVVEREESTLIFIFFLPPLWPDTLCRLSPSFQFFCPLSFRANPFISVLGIGVGGCDRKVGFSVSLYHPHTIMDSALGCPTTLYFCPRQVPPWPSHRLKWLAKRKSVVPWLQRVTEINGFMLDSFYFIGNSSLVLGNAKYE